MKGLILYPRAERDDTSEVRVESRKSGNAKRGLMALGRKPRFEAVWSSRAPPRMVGSISSCRGFPTNLPCSVQGCRRRMMVLARPSCPHGPAWLGHARALPHRHTFVRRQLAVGFRVTVLSTGLGCPLKIYAIEPGTRAWDQESWTAVGSKSFRKLFNPWASAGLSCGSGGIS